MEMNSILVEEWKVLASSGRASEAELYYYDKLFPTVKEAFVEKYSHRRKDGLLISVLGLSPEPIILTAAALQPKKHVIVTTSDKPTVNDILDRYLLEAYELHIVGDSFPSIYGALKDIYFDFPTNSITLDITGGKKSHVASAAMFGKDFGCTVVYVDFTQYLKDLRRPLPGSEILNIVYDPLVNQPELFYGGKMQS